MPEELARWQGRVDAQIEALNSRISDNARRVDDRFGDTAKWIGEVRAEGRVMEKDVETKFTELNKGVNDLSLQITKTNSRLTTLWIVGQVVTGAIVIGVNAFLAARSH